jgi:hypothetical protein
MKNQAKSAILATALLSWSLSAWAVEPHTEHTFKLSEGEAPEPSSLEDAAWLAGSWQGEAFGQRFEEVWNPPSGGSMVGFFKLIGKDGASMYEIMLLTVDDGRLSLKVKHFNPDFTAWEEKGDFVNFKFVAREDNALHFSGISFYRKGPNQIDAYIVMRNKEGIREEKLTYQRVGAP